MSHPHIRGKYRAKSMSYAFIHALDTFRTGHYVARDFQGLGCWFFSPGARGEGG
jgi:hypothetical protein